MESMQVTKIIDEFSRKKTDKGLEVIFKEAVKDFGNGINKLSADQDQVKENAQKIIDTKKTKEQSSLDNLREKYESLCGLHYQNFNVSVGKKDKKKTLSFNDFKIQVSDEIRKLSETYETHSWINYVSIKASEVALEITHIAKLTHSSAKASNINAKDYVSLRSIKPMLVTVNCISKLPFDFAYSTAEYAPVAEFLQLDCGGELLGKLICRDSSVLKPFANDEEQLKKWQENIKLAFNESQKSSHILAKQVFYPVEQEYHLLAPVISSSLAQVIHDRIWQTRQKDDPIRAARKAELYFSQEDILFHQTAILKVTQSQHQNVSNLNGKRLGKLTLLSCQAPQWKTQSKPPITIKSIFNKTLGYRVRDSLRDLQNLLLAIKSNSLSLNLPRKKLIIDLISDVANTVFDCVAEVQSMKSQAGWSQESKLPMHQQYWLDPYCKDEEFQAQREEIDWETDVLNDFSRWINWQVKHKSLTLGIPHEKMWKKILSPLLREFNAITESDVQRTARREEK